MPTDTTKKVEELKVLVDSVAPGSGAMAKELKEVEKKLKDFNTKMDAGVDTQIEKYLKNSVQGMNDAISNKMLIEMFYYSHYKAIFI